jgi:Alpha/beta hydrolase
VSECSAIPSSLIGYAHWGTSVDGRLAQQAQALGAALDAFRSSGPDPKYISSIPPLDQSLSEYARAAAAIDDWAGRVGEAFRQSGQAQAALSARRGAPFDPLTTQITASAAVISAVSRTDEAALQTDIAALVAGARSAAGSFLAEQHAGQDQQLAGKVSRWWRSLDPKTQQQLITSDPSVIGWLDGLPAAVRDLANRELLSASIRQLTAEKAQLEHDVQLPQWTYWEARSGAPRPPGTVTPAQNAAWQQQLARVNGLLQDMQGIRGGIGAPGKGQRGLPPFYLLGLDSNGLGRAIVALGNPDTARNVVTYVPGTGTNLSSTAGNLTRAVRVWTEVRTVAPRRRTSSIYWLGYHAPQLDLSEIHPADSVAFANLANQGAVALDSFAAGLRAAHVPSFAAHTVMLGHSYGSLVVGTAAVRELGRLADDLIFVGSAGVGVNRASQLGIDPSHVWAGEARFDPVPNLPPFDPLHWIGPDSHFGTDPATPPFGARDFMVAPGHLGTIDIGPIPILPNPFPVHSQYWDEGSTSLRNIAFIVAGLYRKVSVYPSVPDPAPGPSPMPPPATNPGLPGLPDPTPGPSPAPTQGSHG